MIGAPSSDHACPDKGLVCLLPVKSDLLATEVQAINSLICNYMYISVLNASWEVSFLVIPAVAAHIKKKTLAFKNDFH
jgi:hypothetical protein